MQSSSVLSIKNATVYRKQTKVFDNFSLELRMGESVAIIGPNGAGKTTLLKLITREIYPVVKPDSFIKLFDEERPTIWDLRDKIGIVSHEFQVAYEAIATGLDVVLSAFFGSVGIHGHHSVKQQQKERAQRILSELGIADLAQKQYLHLSAGQQRRLLLARALVHKPKVLIFDEPTNGLDPKAGFQFLRDMRRACQSGTTLILVTHHVSEIMPEISRVICLKDGKLVADGAKKLILKDERISDLFDTPITVSEINGFYSITPTL